MKALLVLLFFFPPVPGIQLLIIASTVSALSIMQRQTFADSKISTSCLFRNQKDQIKGMSTIVARLIFGVPCRSN